VQKIVKFLLAVLVASAISADPVAAASQVKSGQSCKVSESFVKNSNGSLFVCSKSGKNLKWRLATSIEKKLWIANQQKLRQEADRAAQAAIIAERDKREAEAKKKMDDAIAAAIEALGITPNARFGDIFFVSPGKIYVYWNGKSLAEKEIPELKRVNVFLQSTTDPSFDSSTVRGYFEVKGQISIPVPKGTYLVRLQTELVTGVKSQLTKEISVEVKDDPVVIEPPTLPTGFSVSPTSFALVVDWDGKYISNRGFTGFKSINIYASSVNQGATTTMDLSKNLVNQMTVDGVPNKVTVGLPTLRGALGLSAAQLSVTPVFLYYLAINVEGTPYKENGSITYTRINSTGIIP
jgi:hypothetical protein